MDDMYDSLGRRDRRRESTQHRQQYSFTQPQFKFPGQPQRRDRYHVPPHPYDDVEDVVYDDEDMFDSFDDAVLHQSYEDRQTQDERGHGRLSLAPNHSRHFGAAPPSQRMVSQQPSHRAYHPPTHRATHQDSQYGQYTEDYSQQYQQPIRDPSQPLEFTSEPQVARSSSPAFKASQRRTESNPIVLPRVATRVPQETENQTLEPRPQREIQPAKQYNTQRPTHAESALPHAGPVVQGIPLVPVTKLPDRQRAVFPFPSFNAVQSKCFEQVYKSDDNFVLASPTGSGKTAILELAICRAIANSPAGQFKIIYQAPVKALCSERQRDWALKFSSLNLKCEELTGDSDSANLRSVQTADIIVTTPEKWDSITRKWRDHEKLVRLIKLFLIDEVHILKEERGAILEAVVSRMKSTGTDIRFVALSATVPNLDDVAAWLGKSPTTPYEPANSERFGEEFRPVKLTKHVHGYPGNVNDFAFETALDHKLPDIISKYSQRKPIMIFCMTRKSTVSTAKLLAAWWTSNGPQRRYWNPPSRALGVQDPELRQYISCGVAFHHAGLESNDRISVEKGFLEGDVNVICCTSTLAVGVNLPCHLVIIKNTVQWGQTGAQEYSDLEIMQMIGRAGRPQFDNSAVAVIMTRQAKVRRYETMVTGQEVLESRLHSGLIEHLNAEIGLGTIRDLDSARNWLSKTFLYVRIKKNPAYYKLDGARSGQGIDEQLDDICLRDLSLLQDSNLVSGDHRYKCTDFGEAMARYYVAFSTMRIIVGLRAKAQMSEILSALCQAAELKDIRFRSGEKSMYKALNSGPSIRFPIPITLDLPAHKVSLIIQSVLGCADMQLDKKNKAQFGTETNAVFKHATRLVRCIADCQISLGDAVATNNALMMQRSLNAKAWDDGPYPIKQLPGIGIVSVRNLVNVGLKSIEDIEGAEPHKIEMALHRNPPFGLKLLEVIRGFPKLFVSTHVLPNTMKPTEEGVKIQLKVQIGFMNEQPVQKWSHQSVYVCLLVATSEGDMIHFARISGQKLGKKQDLVIPALLKQPNLSINSYIMCDDIAGTMREASIQPKIPASMFPAPVEEESKSTPARMERPTSNTSKRRIENSKPSRKASDEFDDGGLDDDELARISCKDLDFDHIENYANPTNALTRKNTAKNAAKKKPAKGPARTKSVDEEETEPTQLPNGRWACNHSCKDKSGCKHMCCREGMEKPPLKKPVKKQTASSETATQVGSKKQQQNSKEDKTQMKLTPFKRKASHEIQVMDLTQPEKKQKADLIKKGPWDYRNLHQLHKNVQKRTVPASISAITHKSPAYSYSDGGDHHLSFLCHDESDRGDTAMSTDYGDLATDDLMDVDGFNAGQCTQTDVEETTAAQCDWTENQPDDHHPDHRSETYGDDDSQLGVAMVGLMDSQEIQAQQAAQNDKEVENYDEFDDPAFDIGYIEIPSPDGHAVVDHDHSTSEVSAGPTNTLPTVYETSTSSTVAPPPRQEPTMQDSFPDFAAPYLEQEEDQENVTSSPFFKNTDSRAADYKKDGFRPAKSMLDGHELRELKQVQNEYTEVNTDSKAPPRAAVEEEQKENTQPESSEPHYSLSFEADGGEMQKEETVDERYKDLEPWFLKEFGDVVELVDE